jgi:hypothetical protein
MPLMPNHKLAKKIRLVVQQIMISQTCFHNNIHGYNQLPYKITLPCFTQFIGFLIYRFKKRRQQVNNLYGQHRTHFHPTPCPIPQIAVWKTIKFGTGALHLNLLGAFKFEQSATQYKANSALGSIKTFVM